MSLVVSDLEGTLTAGASWRGIRAYFQEFHSRWAYDRFLLGWLPRYLLVKLGLLNRKKAMDAWMQGEITLLCGERPQVVNMMAEWVVVNHMWPQRRVDVLAKLEKHRRKGAQIAIVSGAYQPIVEAFARRVGDVRAIGSRLSTKWQVVRSRFADQFVSAESGKHLLFLWRCSHHRCLWGYDLGSTYAGDE